MESTAPWGPVSDIKLNVPKCEDTQTSHVFWMTSAGKTSPGERELLMPSEKMKHDVINGAYNSTIRNKERETTLMNARTDIEDRVSSGKRADIACQKDSSEIAAFVLSGFRRACFPSLASFIWALRYESLVG